MKINERVLLTLFLLAFVALILVLTLGLGRVARLVPLAVIIPTLLLLSLQLILDLWPGLSKKYSRIEKKDLFRVEPLREKSLALTGRKTRLEEAIRRGRESSAFMWLALALLMIYLFGFLIALPAHTFLYSKKRSGEGWLMSIAMAAGMFGLVYAVFMLALDFRLHEGQLWAWLSI